MKSYLKSRISWLVVVLMLSSLFVPLGGYAFTGSPWSFNFTGIVTNTQPSGLIYANMYPALNIHSFAPADGALGKPAGDTSLKISSVAGVYPTPTPNPVGSPTPTPYVNVGNPYLQRTMSIKDVGADENVYISAMIASNDYNYTKTLQIKTFISTNTTSGFTTGNLLEMRADRTFNCFGTTLPNITHSINAWYKVDAILYGGTGKVDLYINGIKYINGVPFDADSAAGTQVFTGVDVIRFAYITSLTPGATVKSSSLYVDDFSYSAGTTPPTITPEYTLTSLDTQIKVDENNFAIGPITNTLTVSELLAKVSVTNGATVNVENLSGTVLTSGTAVGNKLVVTTSNNRKIYYSIYDRINIFQDSFSSAITSNTKPTGWTAIQKIGGTTYPFHTTKGESGVGGRMASDQSFVFETINYPGGTGDNDPYIDYTASSGITAPNTVELSIYGADYNCRRGLNTPINNNSSLFREIFAMDMQGNLVANGVNVGKWKVGQWYKFVATLYPGTKLFDCYINGQKVLDKANLMGSSVDIASVNRMKFITTFNQPILGEFVSGKTLIDDFSFYSGYYDPSNDITNLTSTQYGIDNTKKEILIPDTTETSTFYSNINSNGSTLTLFDDASLTTRDFAADYAMNDMILVSKSPSGAVYSYYKVVSESEMSLIKTSDYPFDNSTLKVTEVPVGTTIDTFLSKIVPYIGGQKAMVAQDGITPVTTGKIDATMKLKIISVSNNVSLYNIELAVYANDSFENWNSRMMQSNISNVPTGWISGGIPLAETDSTFYAETEQLAGRTGKAVKFYSNSNTADNIASGFRHSSILKYFSPNVLKDVVALEGSIMVRDHLAETGFVAKYIPAGGGSEVFLNPIVLSPSGYVVVYGVTTNVAFKDNEWNRFALITDMPNRQVYLYMNGVKVYESKNAIPQMGYLTQLRLQHQMKYQQVRTSYFDDVQLYRVYSTADFDQSNISTVLTSSTLAINEGDVPTIKRILNMTAAQLKTAITSPIGATIQLYAADGITVIDDATIVSDGMLLAVTAKDGLNQRQYKLSETPYISSADIKINGVGATTLSAGTLTATMQVENYTETPLPVVLVVAKYKSGQMLEVKLDSKNVGVGTQSFSCSLDPISDTSGVLVKVMALKGLDSLMPLIKEQSLIQVPQ